MMSSEIQTHSLLVGIFVKHPIVGAISSLLLAITGRILPFILEAQIPIIYMQLIQICVWTIGGIAGVLTIMGFFRKKK